MKNLILSMLVCLPAIASAQNLALRLSVGNNPPVTSQAAHTYGNPNNFFRGKAKKSIATISPKIYNSSKYYDIGIGVDAGRLQQLGNVTNIWSPDVPVTDPKLVLYMPFITPYVFANIKYNIIKSLTIYGGVSIGSTVPGAMNSHSVLVGSYYQNEQLLYMSPESFSKLFINWQAGCFWNITRNIGLNAEITNRRYTIDIASTHPKIDMVLSNKVQYYQGSAGFTYIIRGKYNRTKTNKTVEKKTAETSEMAE
jgi:hypothetical protein